MNKTIRNLKSVQAKIIEILEEDTQSDCLSEEERLFMQRDRGFYKGVHDRLQSGKKEMQKNLFRG